MFIWLVETNNVLDEIIIRWDISTRKLTDLISGRAVLDGLVLLHLRLHRKFEVHTMQTKLKSVYVKWTWFTISIAVLKLIRLCWTCSLILYSFVSLLQMVKHNSHWYVLFFVLYHCYLHMQQHVVRTIGHINQSWMSKHHPNCHSSWVLPDSFEIPYP